jgi:ribosomal protein L16 Arg81 hydroxylase
MTSEGETSDRPGRPTLARCIRVTPEEFATAYWGRQPLLSRAGERPPDTTPNGKLFDDLMTVADVDELVSQRGLRTPFLRMARGGQVLNPRDYTGPGGAGAQIADQALDERVLAAFADGATLVLQGVHRVWPPVGEFARRLASELAHPVGVNAYLTPAQDQGFNIHYDTHDVFVLQTAGAKQWRVHRPGTVDPLPSRPWDSHTEELSASTDDPPVLDVCLEPGDSLYLPRGWPHSAQARRDTTMHLTVGVFPVTRYAVLEALLSLAAEEPELRRSLPLGSDPGDPDALAAELAGITRHLTAWLSRVEPEPVAEKLRAKLWRQRRPTPIRPLAQAAALRSVSPATRIMPRGHLPWQLADTGQDTVALRLFDRTVRFPASCREALGAVLSGRVQRVGDLPGLDPEAQVVLAQRLLREAVVVSVDA